MNLGSDGSTVDSVLNPSACHDVVYVSERVSELYEVDTHPRLRNKLPNAFFETVEPEGVVGVSAGRTRILTVRVVTTLPVAHHLIGEARFQHLKELLGNEPSAE